MNKLGIYFAVAIGLGVGASSLYNWKYDDWIAIPKARELLQSKLRDPESAQFRNERLTKTGVLCGEVNSKNGMGGYVGFKRYFSHGAANYIEGLGTLDEETTRDMIARLEKQNEIMKRYIAIRDSIPDGAMPSSARFEQMALEEIFEEKWKEACIA